MVFYRDLAHSVTWCFPLKTAVVVALDGSLLNQFYFIVFVLVIVWTRRMGPTSKGNSRNLLLTRLGSATFTIWKSSKQFYSFVGKILKVATVLQEIQFYGSSKYHSSIKIEIYQFFPDLATCTHSYTVVVFSIPLERVLCMSACMDPQF